MLLELPKKPFPAFCVSGKNASRRPTFLATTHRAVFEDVRFRLQAPPCGPLYWCCGTFGCADILDAEEELSHSNILLVADLFR